jgi:predicted DCC family thiol-disulfide oxidoreductase YuxK
VNEEKAAGKFIILFDGVCNFCNRWVQLIIRYDKKDIFRFTPLQSVTGQQLLAQSGQQKVNPESVVLIENGKYYFRSSAALRIFFRLSGLWKLLIIFYIVPVFIRDAAYNIIARNRYPWFGRRENCMVPDEKTKAKFL